MLGSQRKHVRYVSLGLAALVLGIAAISVACQRDGTASAQDTSLQRSEVRTISVPVEGMICVACAGRVKTALKAVHGVRSVEVSLEKRNARVEYKNHTVTLDQLTHSINELGYKAGAPVPTEPR